MQLQSVFTILTFHQYSYDAYLCSAAAGYIADVAVEHTDCLLYW